MAKRSYINALTSGAAFNEVYLVRDKDLRTASNGSLYICCTLVDRTGTLPARIWQASESLYNGIPTDGFVQVKGRAESYRGSLQAIIEALRPMPADQVDLAEFLPTTPYDIDAMWAELLERLDAIADRPLRALVQAFLDDEALMAQFRRCPAAMQMHQAYLGGLLEHTLHVMRLAGVILPLYPQLNGDLLLAGAFVHDLGKIAELKSDLGFSYTDRGQLVGHITLAAIWLAQKADALAAETGESFPAKTLDLLQHMVLSHHGVYEYGSPKLPAIPEAMALHYLDNLDAKVHMFLHQIAADADPNASFTSFQRQLDVRIYKHSATLGDGASTELFALGEDVQ